MASSSTQPPPDTITAAHPDSHPRHPGLPHIPVEILRQIATHLDVPSALALAQTCKTLRDAGETKVWETVNVTSGFDPLLIVGDLPLAEYRTRQTTISTRAQSIVQALQSHPYRVECIRTLRLEVSDGQDKQLANSLMELLRLVVPYITRLDLVSLPVDGDATEADDAELWASEHFYKALVNDERIWHRVATLKIALPQGTEAVLPAILAHFPNLVCLSVASAEEAYLEEYNEKIRFAKAFPAMPTLRRLTFNHLAEDDCSSRLLGQLLSFAPDVEFVRLMSTSWDPRRKDPGLVALSELKKLKSIVLLTTDGLDYDRIARLPLETEEAVCEDASLDETNELCFENFQFPKLPSTKRMTILTGPRMPIDEYAHLGMGPTRFSAKQPVACGHISPHFIHNLRRVPHLEWVLLHYDEEPSPSLYHAHPVEPEYLVPPDRWESEGYRGAIIRRYPSPGGTTDDFWHIRAISRALDHPTGPALIGARRSWRDFTHYRGRTVPWDTLLAAYAAAGLPVGWLDGGRDMVLGEKGFEVLQRWRDAVPDESDIEEFGEGEDETDDEGDSDTEDEDGDDEGDMLDVHDLHDIMAAQGYDVDDEWETDVEDDGDESDDPIGGW